jgi:predicted AAA+ superfamily ATPase
MPTVHANGQFLLTGSQKFTLMKNVSESLAGRADIVELETLSLAEIHSLDQFCNGPLQN